MPHIDDISGMGFFLSMEIVKDKGTKSRYGSEWAEEKLKPALLEAGLFARLSSSWHSERLYFAPASVMTMDLADRSVDLMYSVVKDIDKL